MNKLSSSEIEQGLIFDTFKDKIKIFDTIDSTNKKAKILINKSDDKEIVIISEEQTSGIGRFEREFFSPSQKGIYMSIALKDPFLSIKKLSLVTVCVATSVANIVKKLTNRHVSIKWVNDILIDGKKVCGILTESSINSEADKIDYIIIGVGINIYNQDYEFPFQLKSKATSLIENKLESETICRNKIISDLLNEICLLYNHINDKEHLKKYISFLNIIGKEISILDRDFNIIDFATVLDVDDYARLFILDSKGNTKYLNSGEISIREKIIE